MRSKENRHELINTEIEKVKAQFTGEIKDYMAREGLKQKGISLILNNSQAFTSKLLSGEENVSLEKMVEIMYYIGKRIKFSFEDLPVAQRMFNQIYRD